MMVGGEEEIGYDADAFEQGEYIEQDRYSPEHEVAGVVDMAVEPVENITRAAAEEDLFKPFEQSYGRGSGWRLEGGKWQAKTVSTMGQAKNLTRYAMTVLQESSQVKDVSTVRNVKQTKTVQTMFKKKISVTNDLIKGLDDRIESVEDTIRQLGDCLFTVQRSYRSKWAPLNVCEQRLELREGRPLQELIKDSAQQALEHERQTLMEARQELANAAQKCRDMLLQLDSIKGELLTDISHKRHGLRVDRSCLSARQQKNIGKSPNEAKERMVLPNVSQVAFYDLPPSPKESAPGTGLQHEAGRETDTKALLNRAVKMEEDAMRLCNDCDAIMLHTKRECSRASAASMLSLQNRASEVHELRQKLDTQLGETEQAILATQQSLKSTQKKVAAHEQPLRVLDKQFDLRNARTNREHIRDPVQDELESHLEAVKKSVTVLNEKYNHTKDVLDQLLAAKSAMAEDLRCKAIAARIDDQCIKVTPRKAMELDRRDPRGGRCKEPSARRPGSREYGNMTTLPDFS
eukprot:TRINITY_DN23535_c0_g1_i1.p1 TRINITY_DN23535_c0_g1~~TRINITY_DN23535_c0_g1_i1.p1  ORF type:complete len:518 (-),score=84.99 TRINITY_DN23535_c0_g1_i1:402-1955(-)